MKKKENWKQNRWIIRGAAVFAALALTGCTGGTVTAGGVEMDSAGLQQMDLPSAEGKKIRMSSGDVEVTITLNDSRAAAELAAILPLRLHLIERSGFAKGMTLPVTLSSGEERTRSYKIGDFGYWPEGPDLAIFYDDIYEQTMVAVIPLGEAGESAAAFGETGGEVLLELEEEE